MDITRKLIRADGTEITLEGPHAMADIMQMIGAETLDVVRLRHMGEPPHTMLVDDEAHMWDLPINDKASALYHANCRPGTTHPVRGDVVIVPDHDFVELCNDHD